ncbi:MAG TPA: hypothetical protein VLN56_09115 [Gammaproteobacteria bacterium]|nr:hypothetical protein [Gammaproteobacteria bacterium]
MRSLRSPGSVEMTGERRSVEMTGFCHPELAEGSLFIPARRSLHVGMTI